MTHFIHDMAAIIAIIVISIALSFAAGIGAKALYLAFLFGWGLL